MKSLLFALLPLALLTVSGCSQDASEDSTASDAAPAAGDLMPGGPAATAATEAQKSSAAFSPADDSAEAAVRAMIEGVAGGHPEVVWSALPSGYQKKINELVQTFAANMDPQLWAQILEILQRVHNLIDMKSEFIANLPELQAQADGQDVNTGLEKAAGLLQTLVTMMELESLKKFDGHKFLNGPGANLLDQIDTLAQMSPLPVSLADLKNAKIEIVSADGDSTVLNLISPTGESRQIDWVRVESRWVPAEVAEDWVSVMADVQLGLAELPAKSKEAGAQFGLVAAMINGVLLPLESAEDQEQFNMAVQNLMGQAMGMMFMGAGGPDEFSIDDDSEAFSPGEGGFDFGEDLQE